MMVRRGGSNRSWRGLQPSAEWAKAPFPPFHIRREFAGGGKPVAHRNPYANPVCLCHRENPPTPGRMPPLMEEPHASGIDLSRRLH